MIKTYCNEGLCPYKIRKTGRCGMVDNKTNIQHSPSRRQNQYVTCWEKQTLSRSTNAWCDIVLFFILVTLLIVETLTFLTSTLQSL